MDLWHGLAVLGVGAIGVALLAVTATRLAIDPGLVADGQLIAVAYVSFFGGTAVLLSAVLARGVTQVNRAVGLARRTE